MFSQADYLCPGMRTCDDGPRNWSNRSPVSTKAGKRQINLQYSLLHACNKAETWKHNIKGCSLWARGINNISGEERSFSFSPVPRGLSHLGEVMSGGGLCHVPVTYPVSSPATSRWMLLSIGPRKEKLGSDSLLLGRDARSCCAVGDNCVLSGHRSRQQGGVKAVWESGSLHPSMTLKGPGYAPRCKMGKAASCSGSFLF